ncbi:RHS repeat domain-containing protein [Undibacterium sp. Ji22W]|uniref:RHS repeat domain-containing protein n=1 Tax=Undibacterium sp. Ji22W TaxID=3413038 RepID=UPI003BF3D408
MKSQKLRLNVLALSIAAIFVNQAQADTRVKAMSFTYDVKGLLTEAIREPNDPQLNLKTAYTYDWRGNRITTTVSSTATGTAAIPSRVTQTVAYDSSGISPISSTNALGQKVAGLMDLANMPVYIDDLNGIRTNYEYDEFQRKTKEYRAGVVTNYTYGTTVSTDTSGASCPAATKVVITQQAPYNVRPWVVQCLDGAQREIRRQTQGSDPAAVITQDTEYDSFSRVARTSRPYYKGTAYPSPTIYWTTNTYDALGRIIIVTAPDGSQTKTSYNGLTTIVTNALNQTQTIVKNALGQVVQVIDFQSNQINFTYDVDGNLLSSTDPQGNVSSASYDALGRKVATNDPDMGNWTYSYDALGEVVQQTDAKGNVTTNSYDVMGRIVTRSEPDMVSTWEYDSCTNGKGRICKVSADNGYARETTYDSSGRVSTIVNTIDARYMTNFNYNGSGQILSKSTGEVGLTYNYSNIGYLQSISSSNSTSSSQTPIWFADAMDAEGRITKQRYNQIRSNTSYDPATGRVLSIKAGLPILTSTSGTPVYTDGTEVQNLSYTYDARGNVLSRTDVNQNLTESFLYDSLNRLTSNTVNASGAGIYNQTYAYNSIGNITNRSDVGSYTYGTTNSRPHGVTEIALASGGKRLYNYDANGNLVQEVQVDNLGNTIAAQGRTESYTSANMPSSLSVPNATLNFSYGTERQRTKQVSPSGTTIYVHPDNAGGLGYEKETRSDGTVEHRYFVTVGSNVIGVIKAQLDMNGDTNYNTLYFHRDPLGSVTAVSNGSSIVENLAYEPFGKRRTVAGALDTNNTVKGNSTNRGYTNHEHLDAVGLIHMNGRIYDPAIGRFISADPNVPYASNIQSYNRLSYTRNNPMMMIDPSGFVDMSTSCQTIEDEDGNRSEYCFGGGDPGGDLGGGSGGELEAIQQVVVRPKKPVNNDEDFYRMFLQFIADAEKYSVWPQPNLIGGDSSNDECKGRARVLKGNKKHIGKAGGLGTPGVINSTSAALIPSQWGGKRDLRAAYKDVSGRNATTGELLFDNARDVAGGNSPVSGYSNARDWFLATYPDLLYIELPGAQKDQGFMDVVVTTPDWMPCPKGTTPTK